MQDRVKPQYAEQISSMGGLRVAECDLGRLDKFWSKYLLEQNVIVTMSGSKFFRGPAHSEAILVPP